MQVLAVLPGATALKEARERRKRQNRNEKKLKHLNCEWIGATFGRNTHGPQMLIIFL